MHMASGGKIKIKGQATVLAGPGNEVKGSGKAVTVTIIGKKCKKVKNVE